ncbi:MAG TPA: hypothetical protein VGA62_08120 [Acidimicrobiia bacterium]
MVGVDSDAGAGAVGGNDAGAGVEAGVDTGAGSVVACVRGARLPSLFPQAVAVSAKTTTSTPSRTSRDLDPHRAEA